MTEAERDALMERVGDKLLLCLEEATDHVVSVVFGEKRLALVPRHHEKIKAGPVLEFRLIKAPKPEAVRNLPPEELAQLAEEVAPTRPEVACVCLVGSILVPANEHEPHCGRRDV